MHRSQEQARRDIVVARNILDIMQSARKPMSYKDLSLRIKELDRGNWMHWRVLRYPLGRVLDACSAFELPLLPVMVVNRKSHLPGKGFFEKMLATARALRGI